MKDDRQQKPADAASQFDEETEERDDAVIGRALRWSLVVFLILASAAGAIAFWLTRPQPPPPVIETKLAQPEIRKLPQVEIPALPFVDVTQAAGITFVHENGAYGDKLLPETMGGGCAFLDIDNDGDQDILFVNSRRWPWDKRPAERSATMGLFRNDGNGRYEDVTTGSGLDVSFFGMGAAAGDYDNDGDVDIFISAVGPNHLFRNDGDGRFTDVTAEAGVAGDDNEWSTSGGFFDFDNDGDLDLFVCNYVRWSKDEDLSQNFTLDGKVRAYGRPQDFQGTFPYLYRNDGGGKFTDVSAAAGIQQRNPATKTPVAKSLGVSFADLTGSGFLDVVVANDTVQNFLFRNVGNGTFEECAAQCGVAFDINGNARGAMGIDIGRFRNDDCVGVAVGNFANEPTALYVSRRGAPGEMPQFTDEAESNGLRPLTRLVLTFGVFFFDADLDGRLDLFAANGHLEDDINLVQASQFYEQPQQLLWNCGPEHASEFLEVTADKSGPDLTRRMVGRGAAYADIDGDGDLDVLIAAIGRAPRLLRNDQKLGHHWLRVKLTGKTCNPDAIGAWVEVHLPDRVLHRQVMPTRSYLSQSELPVTFGLDQSSTIERILVKWPDGSTQPIEQYELDSTLHVTQQAGEPAAAE